MELFIYFLKHAIDFVHALLFSSSAVLALINIIKVLRKQQSQFPQSILINRTRGEINIIMGWCPLFNCFPNYIISTLHVSKKVFQHARWLIKLKISLMYIFCLGLRGKHIWPVRKAWRDWMVYIVAKLAGCFIQQSRSIAWEFCFL